MAEILVLAIDRDNDFGFKGNVKTPAIGIEEVTSAVLALGIADPEDSDVNALLAAIGIYRDLEKDGESVEIALICGNRKVGHRSDLHLIEELDVVIQAIGPKRSILVDDGAEDELVYPIISSRIAIDSVRRVYVKQSPGIEGSLYIFKKTITDPQKKERFLTPLGVIMVALALLYISANSLEPFTKNIGEVASTIISLIILVAGLTIILYSSDILSEIIKYIDKWKGWAGRNKTLLISTSFLSLATAVGTFAIFNSVKNLERHEFASTMLVILSYSLWVLSLIIVLFDFGKFLSEYTAKEGKCLNRIFKTALVFVLAFITQNLINLIGDLESTTFTTISAISITLVLITEFIIFLSRKRRVNGI